MANLEFEPRKVNCRDHYPILQPSSGIPRSKDGFPLIGGRHRRYNRLFWRGARTKTARCFRKTHIHRSNIYTLTIYKIDK